MNDLLTKIENSINELKLPLKLDYNECVLLLEYIRTLEKERNRLIELLTE